MNNELEFLQQVFDAGERIKAAIANLKAAEGILFKGEMSEPSIKKTFKEANEKLQELLELMSRWVLED